MKGPKIIQYNLCGDVATPKYKKYLVSSCAQRKNAEKSELQLHHNTYILSVNKEPFKAQL